MTDTERLDWLEGRVRESGSGVTLDRIPSVDGEPGGFRFMRRFFISEPQESLRATIDDAMAMLEDGGH